MKTPFLVLFLVSTPLVFSGEEPRVINDIEITRDFKKQLGEFGDKGIYPTRNALGEETAKASGKISFDLNSSKPAENAADAVYLIGSVYKCDKCDDWHLGGIATAWALDASGVLVTNAHVISKGRGSVMGVMDWDGNAYPVTEVVAADIAADIAIFRVEGEGMATLPLASAAEVGSRVRVISHPQQRFFMETFGDVSRYFRRPARSGRAASTWMNITADYAKGSSGGPVLDSEGSVVGMVASTISVYFNSPKSAPKPTPKATLQMVVKNAIPVSAIAAMVTPSKATAPPVAQ